MTREKSMAKNHIKRKNLDLKKGQKLEILKENILKKEIVKI
jgi:hypothetical protein